MISSFIITFREALEVALIVGIILSYLGRTNQTKYNNIIYIGVISGVIASIIGALLFNNIAGGFTGRSEEIFEGITMLVGAILLTTMILWMMKQEHFAIKLENKIANKINKVYKYELFLLVFVAILREGIETVIFLGAAAIATTGNTIIGAVSGIVAAIALGYLIFVSSKKIKLKKFFHITNVLLILFAAGLIAHGIHELQEAKIIPIIIEHVWDINPPQYIDGSYPVLHEKGYIGSIMKGLFGYNGNPSLIEILSYTVYLFLIFTLWRKIERLEE